MMNGDVITDCVIGRTVHGVSGQEIPTYSIKEDQETCATSAMHPA